MKMKKNEILDKLRSGICEITYTDSHSVEHSMIGTLALNHLPDGEDTWNDVDMIDMDNDQNVFSVFNVNTENHQTIAVHSVIDIEQLTGEGAVNNEKKLTASAEYIESLFGGNSGGICDADDDLDSMEHPEL